MKKNLVFICSLLLISACGSNTEPTIEKEETNETEETVVHLGQNEEVDNQVFQKYFSTLSDFPEEQGSGNSNEEDGVYSQKANGWPVRNEEYFSNDNLGHYIYDSNEDRIEVAYILYEGATIQGEPLTEDLYVSWIYGFSEEELSDFIQENQAGEAQDRIHFSDEEWKDYSEGHRDTLLQLLD